MILAALAIAGGTGLIGAACVIPQTARDIRPDAKIEQAIRLIAIVPEQESWQINRARMVQFRTPEGHCESPLPAVLVEEVPMTVKIDSTEPNVFPAVEGVDVHDAGRNAEVILGTKIEGQLTTVTIKLSYEQAEALADLLEPFRKS